MKSPITGPLFKWFGSKWTLSKHYPAPVHECIFEPFAGSAGYSLRHCEKQVTLWEDNDNVRQLWYGLILDANESSIREIPCGLAIGTDIRQLGLAPWQALLLKHWQRTNNVGNCWTISPWGHLPGQWTENTRARVATEVGAIKHWKVEPVGFTEHGTYFIDPPYMHNYRYGFGASEFDYHKLKQTVMFGLNDCQIIACEARHPKTGEAPDYLPFVDFRRQVTSRRKEGQSTHSRELIYTWP